jgi:hypothetical protein
MVERGVTDCAGLVRFLADEKPLGTLLPPLHLAAAVEAAEAAAAAAEGGHTFSSGGGVSTSVVGWCRLTLSSPRWKRLEPWIEAL